MTDDTERVFVIAEAGVNHNGALGRALQLVEAAAAAGADAVKFQSFKAERLVSSAARKADYQVRNTGGAGAQIDMLRALELSAESHRTIAARCREAGIKFMSSAFDRESLRFLADFDVPAFKIPSGDVTAAPLLLDTARMGRPMILSTGMCTLSDIESALGVLAFGLLHKEGSPSESAFDAAFASPAGQATLERNVTLLHCTTEYPAPLGEVNLRAMNTLRSAFGLPVGYSDHTMGSAVALAAVACGATVIEKHFTLDRNLPGPDHKASLEPGELAGLVRDIRAIEVALGSPLKAPSVSELKNRHAARRSLVAARAIQCGERFTDDNLTIKRPGEGISPARYWEFLGRKAAKDYAPDELIEQ